MLCDLLLGDIAPWSIAFPLSKPHLARFKRRKSLPLLGDLGRYPLPVVLPEGL